MADKIVFDRRYKHGTLDFHPGPVYEFEDPDAAPFFKALGIAEDVEGDVEGAVLITMGELDIHPCTLWGNGPNKWKYVMPDRAAAAKGITLEEAQAYVATEQEAFPNG